MRGFLRSARVSRCQDLGATLFLVAIVTGCASSTRLHAIQGHVDARPDPSRGPLVVLARPALGEDRSGSGTAVLRRTAEALSPALLIVAAGQHVSFRNEDEIYHSFFSSSGASAFPADPLAPGASRSIGFRHAGVVQVYCSLHSMEHATLLVVPATQYSVVAGDGTFAIAGLAAGDYALETWNQEGPLQRVDLTVPSARSEWVEIVIAGWKRPGSG